MGYGNMLVLIINLFKNTFSIIGYITSHVKMLFFVTLTHSAS